MPTKIKEKTTLDRNQDRQADRSNLDRRYGKIGIEAVAAALQYWTTAKKPGVTAVRIDERFIELPV